MPDVKLKTRIQNKYKTLNEWNEVAAGDFIPLKGEVCYAVDKDQLYQKIGDGITDFTQLNWLKSQSVQSDHAENNEQSAAYIKNRLGYIYEKELSVEEGLLGTLSGLAVEQFTKEEIRSLIDQLIANGELNTEGLDTTLPEDIASYYLIQPDQDNALTKPLTENFCIRFKSGDEVFNINSKDCLISQCTQYKKPYTLIMEGSARLANIVLRLSDIQAPLYDMSINPDKKYTMISLINNNDLSSLTTLFCDAAMYDSLENTTDIVFFENVKEIIQPIDSKYLIEAQSNYDEMDSSNASYIYNRYGNISTGTFFVNNANPAKPYIGQVILDTPTTLGRPNYNRFEFTENYCESEMDLYVGEVAYDTFKVTINEEVFEQSPIFYGKELLAPGTAQDVLTYIGNPKFLSDMYSILGESMSDGKTADNADNGLPFLLTFDFNSSPSLVNCMLDLPYAEGDDLFIQIDPQAQSLAKKVIPKELLPDCGCPWVYNEDKQSLLAPTAYEASGVGSFAVGLGTSAIYNSQMVIGQYNIDQDKAFIIGQGDADNNRKNIFSVDREGNVEATNFIANYVDENGEKSTVSLSEISNLITRIESLENEEPYIPQKGVDYFTEFDKKEIVNNIIEYFGGSPILGYVDENNNIIITSDLENGTYIFKYEESNGAYANIGNLTIGNIISYFITNSLVGCSADINNTSIINENETITLKYVANEGFIFDTAISVNGASYTWDASTGTLVLSNPTENVTIIITATKDGYTNIIDTVGYTNGVRLSNSTGETKALADYTTTGLITVPAGATIRTKGVNFNHRAGTCNIVIWKNNAFITANTLYEASGIQDGNWNGFSWSFDNEGNMILNYSSDYVTYIQICGYGDGENLIVTINEEIVD